jgi:CCR4-NOT transcription complex subunit 4
MLASQQEKASSSSSKDQPKRKKEAKPKKDKQEESRNPHFDDLLKKAFPPGLKFVYAHPPHFTEEDMWIVENMPPLFDLRIPRRKRELREREAAERLRQHQEAQRVQGESPFEADDSVDAAPPGSSQLGGEPEERGFSQNSLLSSQVIGSSHQGAQNVGFTEELSGLGSTRNPAPQANQQTLLQQLKSGSLAQGTPASHGRQPSRYFLNEAPGAALKNYQKQPASAAQAQYSAQSPSVGGHFNYTSVQGPPPGLKTSGTPPVSGGGMFAQGHGFTQGFGRENEKYWELRGRAASGAEGKRELPFPYHQYPSTSAATPTAGALGFPYGSQAPVYPDPGPQKQKKKGKKHRHANTSSSGGGVVDVADPSILQMRVGSAMAGQGYAGQGQGGFPSMHANAYRAW